MKNITVNVRLVILIPIVFAGVALLAAIGSFHIARRSLGPGADADGPVLLWCVLVTGLGFLLGFIIMRALLKPVDKLVAETGQLEVVKALAAPEAGRPERHDEMAQFAHAVNQVTELLGQLEAERLFPAVIGHSRKLLSVLSLTRKIAASDASVLIVGESGTGKELIARGLHDHSPRCRQAFVAVNCAAIPAALLESELFGHEKGAFTGAQARRIGSFETAAGGTLFLDEIGDMPLQTQAKILRAIEQKEIQRVGSPATIQVDARIVAATNKDLPAMVSRGEFREDLFFRINVFYVALPSLRERREDVSLLAAHFLKGFGKALEVSPEALALLTAYPWPGNVRELRNAIETASVLAETVILPVHLPSSIARVVPVPAPADANPPGKAAPGLNLRLEEIERAMVIEALSRAGGVQARAAELLGITQRSLWHRVAKLTIDVAAIKQRSR